MVKLTPCFIRVIWCEVWSFGKGEYGRLGNGSSSDLLLPEPVDLLLDIGKCTKIACAVPRSHFALMENGSLYAWGRNEQGQCGVGGSMSMDVYSMEDYPMEIKGDLEGKCVDIGAGYGQALATVETGELYQWGMAQWLAPRYCSL